MKCIAFILAIYILILTVLPATVLNNVGGNKHKLQCCGNSCVEKKGKNEFPKKQEQNRICNPFQACAYCFGFYISEMAFEVVITPQVSIMRLAIETNFISTFCADVFHPPNTV